MIKKHGRRITRFCLIVAISSLTCSKVEQKPQQVVASIGDFNITFQDFSDQFERLRGAGSLASADAAAKRKVLDDMIGEQIKLFEAYRLGIDKDEKILAVCREKERELAAKALRRQEVDDTIVTEALLQQYYQWSDRELDILYMKFFAGDTDQGKAGARKKAEAVLRQLDEGVPFQALAARYSEHDAARTDSGRVGRIDCYYPVEGFFQQAYPLPEGGVSQPFYAGRSLWIVKVQTLYPVERKPYAQVRGEILARVQDRYGNQIAARQAVFNKELLAEYHFTLLRPSIDLFCRRAKEIKSAADTAGLFTTADRQTALCTNDLEETTIALFLPRVISYYWNALHDRRTVDMLLTEMNLNRLAKDKAMRLRVNETPAVKQEYQNWLVYFLKKNVIQRHVVENMDVSDAVLMPLYEAKRNAYVVKKQATVREIFRKTREDMDQVYSLAKAGHDFAALQKKYCQNRENKNNGIVGPFPAGMNGKMGELAFAGMQVGDISRPFQYRGGFSIFKLLALEPERIKTYAEAKEEIKTGYIQSHWEQAVADWVQRARKNYKIKIDI